ncbi:MAG: hypothetical protein D6812_18050 [Deltaproteobacteria bacterium]|nr:MAG: hypothetical protein D6812_18050 [Deltaproteobacteria bacterium]
MKRRFRTRAFHFKKGQGPIHPFLLALCAFLLLLHSPVRGEEGKRRSRITLKDGSTIYAELVAFEKGVYTFRSDTLGTLKLAEGEVTAIEAPEKYLNEPAAPDFDEVKRARELSDTVFRILSDVNAGSILDQALPRLFEHPELLERLMKLEADPAFSRTLQELAQDPQVTAAVAQGRYDLALQRIMANPRFASLVRSLLPKKEEGIEAELDLLEKLFGTPQREGKPSQEPAPQE